MSELGELRSAPSENLSEGSDEGTKAEAARLLKLAAEPRPVGDSVKDAIWRAARAVGFACDRAKRIWYGEAKRIDAEELDKLRDFARERRARIAAARADDQRNIEQLAALRGRLSARDPDFHRLDVEAIEFALRRMGVDLR